MEYRKLPRGGEQERFSVLGLGLGGIQEAPAEEIEQTIRTAIQNGINFFDICCGGAAAYAPFGRAIRDCRDKVFFQLHFGAVYNEKGEYGWSRELSEVKETFAWELEQLGTDYADFGFLHCVDEPEDIDDLMTSGIFDYVKGLKEQGTVRHLGFSSHTPAVANKLLDTGIMDMMLFSLNPAYDYEKGDEYGVGSVSERQALLRRCQAEGVGVSVMKPFFGGKLLTDAESPFGKALSHAQCLQYAIDRPGVLSAVPGVRGMEDLKVLLGFLTASDEEKDYSVIGTFEAESIRGSCVYCGHCKPCPVGINVGLVNKYYDLARVGDGLAVGHYDKLSVKASACIGCGHCDSRCPFGVRQSARMGEIARWFGK
ncbi:MAG: aldo/keto reductase [Clostridia bacterium]|nr:aldo/keto reductase [Clostridia bacterium]